MANVRCVYASPKARCRTKEEPVARVVSVYLTAAEMKVLDAIVEARKARGAEGATRTNTMRDALLASREAEEVLLVSSVLPEVLPPPEARLPECDPPGEGCTVGQERCSEAEREG